MTALRVLSIAVVAAVLSGAAMAAHSASTTALRLDGIGPLKLGMSQSAAVATGWLGKRGTGCELAGPPLPVTFRFTGPKAPAGIIGSAEFDHGKLADLSFTAGVRTATGTQPGRTTVTAMVAAYRRAGFHVTAKFDNTFQGTFVTATKAGEDRIGGFAEKTVVTMLGLPDIAVCE